jgi:hypothetical protein
MLRREPKISAREVARFDSGSLLYFILDVTPTSCFQARKRQKPRDSTTASGETPAQSARALMQRKKTFSRRINYAAVEKLFEKPSTSTKSKGKSNASEKEDDQYRDEGNEKYDDDKDDDGPGDMDYYLDDGYQEEV